jgi:hypothetical protein
MSEPIIASREPCAAEALAGAIAGWCATMRHARRRLRDGALPRTGRTPVPT